MPGRLLRFNVSNGLISIVGNLVLMELLAVRLHLNYMLANLAWMLSDSTGIPPAYARKAGMVQETYGGFSGAFLEGAQGGATEESMVALWASQKRRRLGFRFGYVDANKQAHLMVTRPK